jgi:2-ketocyclohexanecarboxyl-CoA hydrolase
MPDLVDDQRAVNKKETGQVLGGGIAVSVANFQDILYDVVANVATITINRPKSLNSFTGDTLKELATAFDVAGKSHEVGVIVLTGAGERAFCAGGDVRWEAGGGLENMDFMFGRQILECPKPVIARVSGYAIGGGNHVAYCCDITIAADHSVFGQNGPRVGSPAGGYPVAYSAAVLGQKRAREMWMLCRKYTAARALEWGMVNAVVPQADLDAEVRRWADEMLALSPTVLRLVKASFRETLDGYINSNVSGMVRKHAPDYFSTGEQQEGAAAFLEKRRPDFSPWR